MGTGHCQHLETELRETSSDAAGQPPKSLLYSNFQDNNCELCISA